MIQCSAQLCELININHGTSINCNLFRQTVKRHESSEWKDCLCLVIRLHIFANFMTGLASDPCVDISIPFYAVRCLIHWYSIVIITFHQKVSVTMQVYFERSGSKFKDKTAVLEIFWS